MSGLSSPLLVALLVALAVFILFLGATRALRARDRLDDRMQAYGLDEAALSNIAAPEAPVVTRGARRVGELGSARRLAESLTVADLPLTAVEFMAIVLGLGAAGLIGGLLWRGILAGLLLGALGVILPFVYLRTRKSRRQQAITMQLPEILTLLVGGLRAGYGIGQAIEMLVHELPPPASQEFARVARAMALGVPLPRALDDMARRVDTDDIVLFVTAVSVQHELGGNLAQTLETIGQTVRDRITMHRQVRVLTAHQRFTGYVLSGWPVLVGFALFLQNPAHMSKLFQPDLIWLPITAAGMQFIGFLIIRRIVDIKV